MTRRLSCSDSYAHRVSLDLDVNVCLAAPGAASSRCPLVLLRMLLVCRFPDHLLRLLKWLVQSQAVLNEQRRTRETGTTAADKQCIAQLDRILAHW
jgi:hypothetical protein